jgi:hypothetical protein
VRLTWLDWLLKHKVTKLLFLFLWHFSRDWPWYQFLWFLVVFPVFMFFTAFMNEKFLLLKSWLDAMWFMGGKMWVKFSCWCSWFFIAFLLMWVWIVYMFEIWVPFVGFWVINQGKDWMMRLLVMAVNIFGIYHFNEQYVQLSSFWSRFLIFQFVIYCLKWKKIF